MVITQDDYDITVDMLAQMVNDACPPPPEVVAALETLRKHRTNIPAPTQPLLSIEFLDADNHWPPKALKEPVTLWLSDLRAPWGVNVPAGTTVMKIQILG